MGVQSWMIKSWPIIDWFLPASSDHWPNFWHVNTQIRENSDASGLRAGETVWLGVVDGKSVGAAWEWSELSPGVVMLTDPNSIQSNLRFVGADRSVHDEAVAIVCLNRLAHHLPWQPAVRAMLAAAHQHPEVTQERPAARPSTIWTPQDEVEALRAA
ncbi:MAG: hypothetical protein KGJ30_15440 [Burkholderiales bacterium]|nr:hypothetical protein [Burkholderiales bacterium]MDE1929862.1 hypothetical protein [Burkholderiales bacterium]MDE2160307.1 hypothetical protein [Burkholderiales bacterium]